MNLTKTTTKTSQQAAKATAKVLRDQSLEFLKSARSQTTGSYEKNSNAAPTQPKLDAVDDALSDSKISPQELANIKAEKTKRLKDLEAEMEQYRKAREQKEEQLKKQEELEKQQAAEQKSQGVIEPTSKKSRGLMPGMKGKLERMKRKTEMRQPPSG